MNAKKKYTLEFKQEAVKLIAEQGYSQAEASRRLGIPHANLTRWIKELAKDTRNSKSNGKEKKSLSAEYYEEMEMLRKEVKKLKLEREILKKAAAFFANELN